MENIKFELQNKVKTLQTNSDTRHDYRFLWTKVSFAVARDGHIRLIGARAFGVFMVIRTFMDKDRIAYPSLRTIAYLSGCSVTTIQKEIATLINNNWLKKVGRAKNPQGKFGNTKYLILERDLIRGTGEPSFMKQPPMVQSTDGNQGYQ